MAPACTRDRDPSFRSSTTPSSPSPSWTEANLFIRSFLLRRPTRTPYFQGTLCKKAGWAGCLRRIATCSVFTLLDFPPRPRLTFSFRLRPTPTPGDHRSFVRPPRGKSGEAVSFGGRRLWKNPPLLSLFDVLFVRRLIFQRMLEARNHVPPRPLINLLSPPPPAKVPALSRPAEYRARGPVQLDSVVLAAPLLFA